MIFPAHNNNCGNSLQDIDISKPFILSNVIDVETPVSGGSIYKLGRETSWFNLNVNTPQRNRLPIRRQQTTRRQQTMIITMTSLRRS